MRFLRHVLVAAVFVASLAGTAPAAPSTTILDELRTFITSRRDAILPNDTPDRLAERARLTKAISAFGAPSTSLDGDVKILGRVAKIVEGPSIDAGTNALLVVTIFDLGQAAIPSRDALAARIDALVAPKVLSASQQSLADIDASIDAAIAGSGPVSARAQSLRFALATIASTSARISRATACRGGPARPGKGYFACLADDVPIVPALGAGIATVTDGLPIDMTLTAYGTTAKSDALSITFSTGAFTGIGTYDLDGTSGALITLVRQDTTFYSISGRVSVTRFDAVARKVSGTFEGVLDSNSGAKVNLTRGTFNVCAYATRSE